jgi:acyl carrier protein
VNTTDARTLLARLVGRIAPEADLDQIDPDAPLQEELDLDSMDFPNLVTALDDAIGLQVPERDYPALSTTAGFTSYVAAATS